MKKTSIEWCRNADGSQGCTWNPIAMRCDPVSAGCERCWHRVYARRLACNPAFSEERRRAYAGGPVVMDQHELLAPIRRRKPTTIATQLMGDLFYGAIPCGWIATVFDVMRQCPQHRFLVLTKRAGRMRAEVTRIFQDWFCRFPKAILPNVGLGVSAEDQATAEQRIPPLVATPAAFRMVSLEPLLGLVDLGDHIGGFVEFHCDKCGADFDWEAMAELSDYLWICPKCTATNSIIEGRASPIRGTKPAIDWVVAGGETDQGSGGARPTELQYVRQVRDDCAAAGIPFLFKSWGEWAPGTYTDAPGQPPDCEMVRVGRKLSGRLLDGRVHNEMPLWITGREKDVQP